MTTAVRVQPSRPPHECDERCHCCPQCYLAGKGDVCRATCEHRDPDAEEQS